ncbi:MAG: polyphosphate kinase 1, partial [Bacteroidota bacterium]|nr:polyphosphate kinase 1 [Bacteroidota bacterium]
MPNIYRSKEISWLSFNERVLKQTFKEDVPLYERIKFLAIYSNNMDEFYRVRVATLKRLSKLKKDVSQIIGFDPKEIIKQINDIVIEQNILYEKSQQQLREKLKEQKVFVVDENNLNKEQKKYAMEFFDKKLKNSLMPIILRDKKQVLDLVDDTI